MTIKEINLIEGHESNLDFALEKIALVQSFYLQNGVTTALVGSLGRKLSTGKVAFSIYNPISARISDIDLFCIPSIEASEENESQLLPDAQTLANPYLLEETFKGKVVNINGQFNLKYKNIIIPVDNQVFEPKCLDINGKEISVLDATTQFHISALYGPLRPNDFKSLLELGRELRNIPNKLPDVLFDPFHQLLKEVKLRYPNDELIWKIRWMYRNTVSLERRKQLAKFVDPLIQLVEPFSGWVESP